MKKYDLSTNVQKINIYQDWEHKNYNKYLSLNVPFQKISKGVVY